MSAQAIAMRETTLDTAGIGGEMESLVPILGPSLWAHLGFSGLCSMMFLKVFLIGP